MMLNLERYLTIEAKGQSTKCLLRIESITLDSAKGRYVCRWSIEHLCPSGIALGQDPVEALTNVIRLIGLFIHGTEEDGMHVWWQSRGDNGGFPIIKGTDS